MASGRSRWPTPAKLAVAQSFGNNERCIADVQFCGINRILAIGQLTVAVARHHWTGTFSLKIRRGSMNFRVR
ncbi:MAG: hypothetical protein E5X83_07995 [Mesorhizobium sp.]|nr:MAG: hypothetical protein EOR82_01430 [Mesorhizobium sp.]TIO26629.1 MAG: hypothetical protein E5X83_07995 [Mesorhizobium sp.]TJV61517.1 MAG: hypothetical protein E5X82_10745 [Mesorhizobium sp.]